MGSNKPIQRPSERTWDATVKAFQLGTKAEELADGLGIGLTTLRKWFREDGIKVIRNSSSVPEMPELTETEQIHQEALETRLRKERDYYRKLYSGALEQLGFENLVKRAMEQAAEIIPPLEVVSTIPIKMKHVGPGSETDVLQVGDVHAGEVIDIDETYGISQFDMSVVARRLSVLFSKTLYLVTLRRHALNIPCLIVSQGGDMVSGEIHDELVKTNAEHSMISAIRTAFMLAQGIAFLAPHFERIDVPCVTGNHGRMGKKPNFKQRFVNWDYLVYQWEAVLLRQFKNVFFDIPKSPFMLVNAEQTRILITHGDNIKGWMGIPWYGIERFAHRVRELLQAKNDYYDVLLLHHFHCRGDLDKASGPIIINGSLKGGDEFSIGSLQATNKPSQNLVHFDNRHGYIGGEPIYVHDMEYQPDLEIKDVLPDVWADIIEEGLQPE